MNVVIEKFGIRWVFASVFSQVDGVIRARRENKFVMRKNVDNLNTHLY